MFEVVGDVQAGPGAKGGGVCSDQGGQGGAVDDDLALPVRIAGTARGQHRHQGGADGRRSAVTDEADPAGRQRRLQGDVGGAFGQVRVGAQFGVACHFLGDLEEGFGQVGGVVVNGAGGVTAAALQPHEGHGGGEGGGEGPREEPAGQGDPVGVRRRLGGRRPVRRPLPVRAGGGSHCIPGGGGWRGARIRCGGAGGRGTRRQRGGSGRAVAGGRQRAWAGGRVRRGCGRWCRRLGRTGGRGVLGRRGCACGGR